MFCHSSPVKFLISSIISSFNVIFILISPSFFLFTLYII
nr:MAG TPA_asm: hypothetical protein [Caudoviricetes sp.]